MKNRLRTPLTTHPLLKSRPSSQRLASRVWLPRTHRQNLQTNSKATARSWGAALPVANPFEFEVSWGGEPSWFGPLLVEPRLRIQILKNSLKRKPVLSGGHSS